MRAFRQRQRNRRVVIKAEQRLREARFPECKECLFFRPSRGSPECVGCGAGEFFEPKIDDSSPDDSEMMGTLRGMGFDDE